MHTAKSKEWSTVKRDEICQMKAVEVVEVNLRNISYALNAERQYNGFVKCAVGKRRRRDIFHVYPLF